MVHEHTPLTADEQYQEWVKPTPVIERRRELLVVKRDQEFFPFRDIAITFDKNKAVPVASMDFILDDDQLGKVDARLFFTQPFSAGNATFGVGFMPQRFYTLADIPDDLTTIDYYKYPAAPHERTEFSIGFELPRELSGSSSDLIRAVKFPEASDSIAVTVRNHLTGESFDSRGYGVGWNETESRKPNHSVMLFNGFYYADQESDHSGLLESGMLLMQTKGEMAKMQGKSPFDIRLTEEDLNFVDESNNTRSFKDPFNLTFINVPQVRNRIGIIIR